MNRNRGPWILTTVTVIGVALPLIALALQALADQWRGPAVWPQVYGTRGLHAVLDDPNLAAGVANSVLVALIATAVAVVLGWPVARLLSQTRHPAIGVGPVALPLLIPQAAIGTGLSTFFLRLHLAGSITGLTVAHLVQVLPYVTIALRAGFTTQLNENEEAAATLGVAASQRLRFVTLPALAPALLVAAALGFIVSWSQYGTSLVVGAGTPMLPLTMVPYLRTDPQIAAVLTLLFLIPPALTALVALRPTHHPGATVASPIPASATPHTMRSNPDARTVVGAHLTESAPL